MNSYNFYVADTDFLIKTFNAMEKEILNIIESKLPLPAYELVLKNSHIFNIINARGVISVTERQAYILRIRKCAFEIAKLYFDSRKKLNFPLCKNNS